MERDISKVTKRDIDAQVLTILSEDLGRPNLQLSQKLDMSSIQVLKALAHIETTFAIEIEDDVIFHGLFSSPEHLSMYIHRVLLIK